MDLVIAIMINASRIVQDMALKMDFFISLGQEMMPMENHCFLHQADYLDSVYIQFLVFQMQSKTKWDIDS